MDHAPSATVQERSHSGRTVILILVAVAAVVLLVSVPVGLWALMNQGSLPAAGFVLGEDGVPVFISHQCDDDGIAELVIADRDGGQVVFAASLRPGHAARREVSVDSSADDSYVKVLSGALEANRVYVATKQLGSDGRQIDYVDPSFIPAALEPGQVTEYVNPNGETSTRSRSSFDSSRLRCEN